ncbi:MAG: hypothetical protein HY049_12305 [Acidobacteria bacterium]|nr:hypothetical protein [Acidobacteriota bacterium]
MGRGRHRSTRVAIAVAVVASLALGSASRAEGAKKIRYDVVAIRPGLAESAVPGREIAADAARLAYLALVLTPHIDVRWRPLDPPARETFVLTAPAVGRLAGARGADALDAARRMLLALPRHSRRSAVRTLADLGIGGLGDAASAALLDTLRAWVAGEAGGEMAAGGAAGAAAARAPSGPVPAFALGLARLDGGDIAGASEAFRGLDDAKQLPGAARRLVRATRAALSGDAPQALGDVDGVVSELPSLAPARVLRALLRRSECSLYDLDAIRGDLAAALLAHPCCAACSMEEAEMAAFAGFAPESFRTIDAPGCSHEALDSARDRALALIEGASGHAEPSLAAAARAEARDVSALRRGLAPAFLLAGDTAHLDESYDSEADLKLTPAIAVEERLHAGLNALWAGRPAAAAAQFENALDRDRSGAPPGGAPTPRAQLLMSLRVRSYLAAGRIEEAKRAAAEARETLAGRGAGLVEYTAALVDIASGDNEGALRRMAASGRPSMKVWSYLTQAQVHLERGRGRDAYEISTQALSAVGSQLTICPGVSTDAYLLEPNARALLALGKPKEAERVLDRLFKLGGRGLFAPDVIVPAHLLDGQAREDAGDRAGARAAYEAVVSAWGRGEETPALRRARERLAALP